VDPDPVHFEISSRRHLARALRIVATGIADGQVAVSDKAISLLRAAVDEMLLPTPLADPPMS